MLKDRLVKLRKEKKKTQEEIAKIIGVTRPAYTAYEKGTRTPDYDILEMLADYFDVSIDYLLGRTDNPKFIEDQDRRKSIIIEKIKEEFAGADLMFKDLANMTAEQLEEVYDFIKFKLSKE